MAQERARVWLTGLMALRYKIQIQIGLTNMTRDYIDNAIEMAQKSAKRYTKL